MTDNVLAPVIFGIANGSLLALFTFGLVLVYKATSQLNLAHGAFGTTAVLCVTQLGWLGALPLLVVFMVGGAVAGLLAWLSQQIVVRPMRRSSPWSIVVATLAISILLRAVTSVVWGNSPRTFPNVVGNGTVDILGVPVTRQQLFVIVVTALFLLGFAAFYKWTRLGTALRAMAANRAGAEMAGVPVGRLEAVVWVIGGVLAGVTAMLAAPVTFVTPGMLETFLMLSLAAAALAGMTSLTIAVAGALLVGIANEVSSLYVPGQFRSVVPVAIIAFALLARPQGVGVAKTRGSV